MKSSASTSGALLQQVIALPTPQSPLRKAQTAMLRGSLHKAQAAGL